MGKYMWSLITSVFRQEAQLSQRDRAMRRVSWNLANYHAKKVLVWQILNIFEVMKLEVYSGAMCNKHVRSTMTRSSRFHCPIGVINKPTTDDLWISPVYRRLVVSPQYKNCSRDSDHAHLENTHSSQDYDFTWPNRVQNLKSLALAVAKIFHGIKF